MMFKIGTYQVESGGTFKLYHILEGSAWPLVGIMTAPNGLESPVTLNEYGEHHHREVRILLPATDVIELWKELQEKRAEVEKLKKELDDLKNSIIDIENISKEMVEIVKLGMAEKKKQSESVS